MSSASPIVAYSCVIAGNITTGGGCVLRGCAFFGPTVITCVGLTIDGETYAAARTAGVTFVNTGSFSVVGPSVGGIIHFGCAVATAGQYIPPGCPAVSATSGAGEGARAVHLTRPCVLRNLIGFAGGAGGTLAIRKNLGSTTALAITSVAAIVRNTSDVVEYTSADIAAGGYVSLVCSGAMGSDVRASVEIL